MLVSAAVWTLSAAVSGVLFFEVGSAFDQRGVFHALFRWAQVADSIAHPLTLGGFAVYVVFWLESPRER